MTMHAANLQIAGLRKRFSGLRALEMEAHPVTFEPGKVSAVLGGNGAGKTTLFNLMAGVISPDAGNVRVDGVPLDGLPDWKRARMGIARLWQDLRLFPNMTTLQNVEVAVPGQRGEAPWLALSARSMVRKDRAFSVGRALACLEQVRLSEKGADLASSLSYGQQKLLALARVIANDHNRFVLLDEPLAGLAKDMAAEVRRIIEDMRDRQLVVIVIEHDLRAIRDLVDFALFLDGGRVVAQGSLQDILSSAGVRRRYVGLK